MTEKVRITRDQAATIERLKNNTRGMELSDLLEALKNGYEIEPKFKVGDWVTCTRAGTVEKYVGKVLEVLSDGYIKTDISTWSQSDLTFNEDHSRHATPEEIKAEKEHRLWKKLDREVGEFKVGDTLTYRYGGKKSIVDDPDYAYREYEDGVIKSFYPVESLISFEE